MKVRKLLEIQSTIEESVTPCDMNYDDLNSLPNLSPIDVTAVLLQKKRGYINGTWELKNSPGITYYGYKNLRDFVDFGSRGKNKFHLRYSSRLIKLFFQ